jgi:hypothetical protein
VESSLGFGHWDLIGIWGVVIGISARQEPPIVLRAHRFANSQLPLFIHPKISYD